jgi:uncharacterized protein YciI
MCVLVIRKRLFAALNKGVASQDQMLTFIAEHLEYMNRLEKEGKLFASGPFIKEGILVGDGLTIIQTSTHQEAMALMQDEPLIKRRQQALSSWNSLGLSRPKKRVVGTKKPKDPYRYGRNSARR